MKNFQEYETNKKILNTLEKLFSRTNSEIPPSPKLIRKLNTKEEVELLQCLCHEEIKEKSNYKSISHRVFGLNIYNKYYIIYTDKEIDEIICINTVKVNQLEFIKCLEIK